MRKSFDEAKAVGEIIRKCRLEKGFSLNQLSLRAGIDKSTLARYEKGQSRMLNMVVIAKIMRALDINEKQMLNSGEVNADNKDSCLKVPNIIQLKYLEGYKRGIRISSTNRKKRYLHFLRKQMKNTTD